MDIFNMSFHVVFPLEWLVADRTVNFEFLCLMFPDHMSGKSMFKSETLSTPLTGMSVDTPMGVFMRLQELMLCKRFTTYRAGITLAGNLKNI